jgi:hypothetical protein
MMKRLLKSVARSGWRLTGPIRRPIGRKVDAKLARVVATTVDAIVREQIQAQLHPWLDAIEQNIWQGRGQANAHADETNLTLDSLVREIGRLQMQVEVLQQLLSDHSERPGGLSIVGDGEPFEGRAKVG